MLSYSPRINKNQIFCSTYFSVDFICEKLYSHNKEFKEIADKSAIKEISTNENDDGAAGKIFITTIHFENDQKFSFVAKLMRVDYFQTFDEDSKSLEYQAEIEEKQVEIANQIREHNSECAFYECFSNTDVLHIPKIYYLQKIDTDIKQYGIILMEDLSGQMKSIKEPFTTEQLLSIIRQLISFQAFQLNSSTKPWAGKFTKCAIEDFELYYCQKLLKDLLKSNKCSEIEPFILKIIPLVENSNLFDYIMRGCCDDLNLPKLLCYGDMGPGNILWKNESEDRIPEFGAFIDFQQAFEGNPLFDIATLLSNVDNQTRKEMETTIFQEYLVTLKCFLNYNSQKSINAITSLEIEKAYKYALVHEAVLHVAYKAWSLETIDEMWINNSKTKLEEAINFLETCGKNWFEK